MSCIERMIRANSLLITGRCLQRVNFCHRASRPAWKNLLRYRTPASATAGLHQAVAAIDGWQHHSGDRCSPVTGRHGGRPGRVLWAKTGREGLPTGAPDERGAKGRHEVSGVTFDIAKALKRKRKRPPPSLPPVLSPIAPPAA